MDPAAAEADSDPDEVAWSTAVEAAPWLLGTPAPENAVEPDELYDRLAPFKQRVSEDIRRHGREQPVAHGRGAAGAAPARGGLLPC